MDFSLLEIICTYVNFFQNYVNKDAEEIDGLPLDYP